MLFHPPLATGTLIRRYKRFLADIQLADGSTLTIHCPNTGSMRSCSMPGSLVCYSHSDNPKRKYPHTLEMIRVGTTWVGVNTGRTNSLVVEAIKEGKISELSDSSEIQREVTVCRGTRLDISLRLNGRLTYVEVKNCSLVEDEWAMFPDAVTERGTKHLRELTDLAKSGYGACIFYLVQRSDCEKFRPCWEIDNLYGETLRKAASHGVVVLAYQAAVTPESISVSRPLPCHLDVKHAGISSKP